MTVAIASALGTVNWEVIIGGIDTGGGFTDYFWP